MDTFGPITDNAGGIIEMSQSDEEVRKKTDRLDAVGNTNEGAGPKVTPSAAQRWRYFCCSRYMDEVTNPDGASVRRRESGQNSRLHWWPVSDAGLSVQRSGDSRRWPSRYYVINEVRRQFRENAGIMLGEMKPDYARCVDIVTAGALREMVMPGC